MWVTVSPPSPGFPVGPNWHPGRSTSSILSPAHSMPTAPPTQHRAASRGRPQPTALAPGPSALRPEQVCGAAGHLPGRAGIDRRPGKSWLGRSRQGRAGEEQRAAGSLAGASGTWGFGAPGETAPRSPAQTAAFQPNAPTPGTAHPSRAYPHQLMPRAESRMGHLRLSQAAPGTGHRGFLPGPCLCQCRDKLLSFKEGAPFSAGRETPLLLLWPDTLAT